MKDLIIIGAGPAGLSASIYASRYKLDHLVIGSEIGGQGNEAWEVENYPGFETISGKELMEKFSSHAKKFGAEIIQGDVIQVSKNNETFSVSLKDNSVHEAKMLIFALGMKPRKLNIPNEDKFVGKGVSYCATCDAMFFRDKDVVVIGGGDSAVTSAIHLAEVANSVRLMYKEGTKSCEPAWEERMKENSKISCELFSAVTEIKGENMVEGMVYESNGEKNEIAVQGIFIEVGTVPGVIIAQNLGVATDEQGFIIVDSLQATNVENVYAAGDVTTGSNKFRQIITACAEGAVAAGSAYKKLKITKK